MKPGSMPTNLKAALLASSGRACERVTMMLDPMPAKRVASLPTHVLVTAEHVGERVCSRQLDQPGVVRPPV